MAITQFLRDTKSELKQVRWPSRRHLVIYTLVVIVFSLGLGYTLGAFDSLFRFILRILVIN